MNKAILIGNVGKDPEVKNFDWGKVVNFSLATSSSYKKDDEWVNVTDWHNVVVKGGAANYAEKALKKGSRVAVDGEIKNRSYDDRDGNKRYVSEIVCFKIEPQDSKPTTEVSSGVDKPKEEVNSEDDDPFGEVPPPTQEDPF